MEISTWICYQSLFGCNYKDRGGRFFASKAKPPSSRPSYIIFSQLQKVCTSISTLGWSYEYVRGVIHEMKHCVLAMRTNVIKETNALDEKSGLMGFKNNQCRNQSVLIAIRILQIFEMFGPMILLKYSWLRSVGRGLSVRTLIARIFNGIRFNMNLDSHAENFCTYSDFDSLFHLFLFTASLSNSTHSSCLTL